MERFKQFLVSPFQTGKGGLYNLITAVREYVWRSTSRLLQNADYTKGTKVQGCCDKQRCSCCIYKSSIVRSSTTAELHLTPAHDRWCNVSNNLSVQKGLSSQRGKGGGGVLLLFISYVSNILYVFWLF